MTTVRTLEEINDLLRRPLKVIIFDDRNTPTIPHPTHVDKNKK
jgi:hypothetical protein